MNTDAATASFSDSTALLHDPPVLRAKLDEDGYLFLRGVAPVEPMLSLRRAIVSILAEAGWIDSSRADPMDAIWSGAGPFTEGESEYMAAYKRVLHLPEFVAWAEQPALMELAAKVLDGPVLAHRLRIARITFPNNVGQATAAHQDFQYIRGTSQTYTIWTPLGDCPIELGGLSVLRGSHRGGFIEHSFDHSRKYAGHGLTDQQLPAGDGLAWHVGDFAAGDLLLFHSHTIHKALPNLTKDRLRISTDNRYQRVGEAIAAHSLQSHYGM
jgi:ectoine hydroxylase-related dioxygenase (phytanoyl-CoA dioxygenase family)